MRQPLRPRWLAGPASKLGRLLVKNPVAVLMTVIAFSIALLAPGFSSRDNLVNTARQAMPLMLMAAGMTVSAVVGDVDLSVSAVAALASALSAHVLGTLGLSPLLTVLLILVAGAAYGVVVTLCVHYLQIHPFLTGLGLFYVIQGVALSITQGHITNVDSALYASLGGFQSKLVTSDLITGLVVVLAIAAVVGASRLGLHMYVVGYDSLRRTSVAPACAVSVVLTRLAAYVLAGVAAALGGLLLAARLGGFVPYAAEARLLDAILAVILSATLSSRGTFNLWGAIVGVLFLAYVTNGLGLAGVPAYHMNLVKGALIITAVGFASYRARAAGLG